MVKIPNLIKEFIEKQGIFAVGTVGENNLANVSPRIFFRVDENVIYWLDFFKHKSYKNIQALYIVFELLLTEYNIKCLDNFFLRFRF